MSTALKKPEPRAVRHPLTTLRQDVFDILAHTFGEEEDLWPFTRVGPRLDLSETDSAIEVLMDLPGIRIDDVEIQISGNRLTVSGQRTEDRQEKGRTWHRIERRSGKFARSVMLPCPVKEDAADAQYRDGILTITVPKTDEAKAHKVKVRT